MNHTSKTLIAVGFEGWTSFPHSGVCSLWKRKLREALAYIILNYEEKTLAVNVFSDISDETCPVWLEKLQNEYKLNRYVRLYSCGPFLYRYR